MPMTATPEQLDAIMERASAALAGMDYLVCETLCLEALGEARQAERYGYYARVLLPLQEARRQRRMIATQGDIQLGSGSAGFDPGIWLDEHKAGCIVLTHPHTPKEALALERRAREEKRYVEVLFADNTEDASAWALRSYDGPETTCQVSPPKPDQNPAQWFLYASEQLGDAAMRSVDVSAQGISLLDALETRLRVFPDHELLHQRLAQTACSIR